MNDINLSSIGFGLSSIGYLAFWGLLLTVKTRNTQRHLLAIYALLSVLWGLYYCVNDELPFSVSASLILETALQIVTLLFFLAALSKPDITTRQFFRHKKIILVVAVLLLWMTIVIYFRLPLTVRLFTAILVSVALLSILETIYRKSQDRRWQFKPLLLAFGINLLFDFYLFTEAALLDRIVPQTWMARGWIHLVTLPLLVLSINRIKHWGINVYISRDIVLQSSLLLGAGLYLCLLAVAGYYIKFFGGNWTTLLQIVFFGVGATALVVILFSESIRGRFKVFITKHFFANTFDYREKWVELTRELKQIEFANVNTAEVSLQAWCHAVGYSYGCLVRFQHDQFKAIANVGNLQFGAAELKAIKIVMSELTNKHWLLDFSDPKDPLIQQLQSKYGLQGLHFSLLIPVMKNNQLWGFCLLQGTENEKLRLNWELRDYLNAVTEQISSYLFMDEASKALSENAQFVAFSRMSAFVVHDLKNVKAQIDMLLKNAIKHRHNPEFVDDAFATIEAMQSRLQNMLAQLTNKQNSHEQVKKTAIGPLLTQLINERCSSNLPVPTLNLQSDCLLTIDAERFSNVLYHLIDNAQQATADTGSVIVTVSHEDNQLCIDISDTGCGMSQEFIQSRLFKPFDTTKGNAGMGIGAYDALTFIHQQQGKLLVNSEVDKGTTFTISLPLH